MIFLLKKIFSQFLDVFNRKMIELRIKKIKHNLSAQSSALYPDLQKKLLFLQELKYINADNIGKPVLK